jgi:hypothetical protein
MSDAPRPQIEERIQKLEMLVGVLQGRLDTLQARVEALPVPVKVLGISL